MVAVEISKACTIGISLFLRILKEVVNLAKLELIRKPFRTGIFSKYLSTIVNSFSTPKNLKENKRDKTKINKIVQIIQCFL